MWDDIWSDSNGAALVRPDGGVSAQVARKLLAAYEAQQREDRAYGPALLARTGLPVAADIPVITASATLPSADADPATQIIYPFGVDDSTEQAVIPTSRLNKRWLRGFTKGADSVGRFSHSLGMTHTLASYATNGNQTGIDVASGYGRSSSGGTGPEFHALLDGDVLFLKIGSGASGRFDLYVNGHLCSSSVNAPSTGATAHVNGRSYNSTSTNYVKLKWGTVARREIRMVFPSLYSPAIVYLRATHTMIPAVDSPVCWVHQGDSFSTGTAATDATLGLASWLKESFGAGIDFINCAVGSTSLNNGAGNQNPVGAAPVSAKLLTQRGQWLLNARANSPDVLSLLIGHNEAGGSYTTTASELTALLTDARASNPSTLIFVFGVNSSQAAIAAGTDPTIEPVISAACAAVPGVTFFPCQLWGAGTFLRGTGKVGATTGVGNTDLYVSADGVHPSDAGHRAYGQMMATRIADALRAML
jgi:lysophospholipase L1-like esterase